MELQPCKRCKGTGKVPKYREITKTEQVIMKRIHEMHISEEILREMELGGFIVTDNLMMYTYDNDYIYLHGKKIEREK